MSVPATPAFPSRSTRLLIALLFTLLAACSGGDENTLTGSTLATPENLQAVAGDGQVTLSWNAVATAESYSVHWNTTGSVGEDDNALIVTTPLTSHTGLTNGTTYYYRVSASTSSSSSALSSEVSATPQGSALGTTWTPIATSSSSHLTAITTDGAQYLTGGNNSTFLTSGDGLAWSAHTTPSAIDFSDVSWDGKRFLATGTTGLGGILLTSPDATTWTQLTTIINHPLYCLHASDAETIAGGSNIILSTIALQQIISGTINAITWDGSQYLAAGDDGVAGSESILSRDELYTWSSQASLSGVDVLNDIIYTGVIYLAVGNNGVIHTSLDGLTWTAQVSGTSESLNSVTWTGNMFVVAGSNGTLLTSHDGTSWSSQQSGVAVNLQDVIWNGSELMAVGDGGTILTSRAIQLCPDGQSYQSSGPSGAGCYW